MPLFVILFYVLPMPATVESWGAGGTLVPFDRSTLNNYRRWYYQTQDRVIAWHKDRLFTLDSRYRREEASRKLTFARSQAQDKGISAASPEYPNIRQFLPKSDWPENRAKKLFRSIGRRGKLENRDA
ncbi:MAG TPA: hypothetical protein VM103_01365 [Candidatus Paceibacterota bacterium]|nr:hypothetical protein [Candidatus Paceibacterota bacterium]